MKLTLMEPKSADLAQIKLAFRAFPGAHGSIARDGSYTPSAGDSRILSLFIPIGANKMTDLWRLVSIPLPARSSFTEMRSSAFHFIDVYFFKVKRGWSKPGWIGNVCFNFGYGQLAIGRVSGATLAVMMGMLRAFVDGLGKLHDDTNAAFQAIGQNA